VTLSLGVSVIAFTLLLKASTALINVPQTFWQGLSGVIIIALGIAMIFPRLWDAIPFLNSLNKESNKALAVGYQKQNIAGDVLTGAALGPVFSSCSPTYFLILATVLPRSIPEGIIYLLAYSIGLCGGLFVVALAGQKLLAWLGVASDPNGWLKRVVGVLFLALGLAIFFGYDKVAEACEVSAQSATRIVATADTGGSTRSCLTLARLARSDMRAQTVRTA
jgi:cytochrome c biogenesis protein CcdA